MILKIALGSFYSRGDEKRLFQGFEEITAIRDIKGVGGDLLLSVNIAALSKEQMRELLALLWRYDLPLTPLRVLAEKKKFDWLNDSQGYWREAMFK